MNKRFFSAMILTVLAGLIAGAYFLGGQSTATVEAQTKEIPETIILAKEAKFGPVSFSHAKHNGGTYSIDGNGISCKECHHAAQPASELAKHPPLKTAWPADRTTTLTAELFKKDPAAAGVASCRSCHARNGEKPVNMPAIPEIKHESSTAMITLNNQQALHRNCNSCHAEVKKNNPATKAPTAAQCILCHKRTA